MIKDLKNGDYLKLGEICFGLKENKSSLSIEYNDKNFISINLELSFEDGEYNDLEVSPYIEINYIKTSTNKLDDLKGILFELNDVNESLSRGDRFYLNESEPFVKYKIEILEIDEQKAHIKLNGIGITDGYSKPYKTENFTVDAIIPIKIYNNNLIVSKEEQENKNKKSRKDKVKTLVGLVVFGLITGLIGFTLLTEFIKTKNIAYIFISIIMFSAMLLVLSSAFYEVFNNRKKYLKREELIKLLDESKPCFEKEVKFAHISVLFLNIERVLNKYSYKADSRFVTYGRLDFLEKEMHEKIANNDMLGTLINFNEYIRGYSHMFQPSHIPNSEDYHTLLKKYDEYYNDGIICEQEKNKIIELMHYIEYRVSSKIKENDISGLK